MSVLQNCCFCAVVVFYWLDKKLLPNYEYVLLVLKELFNEIAAAKKGKEFLEKIDYPFGEWVLS